MQTIPPKTETTDGSFIKKKTAPMQSYPSQDIPVTGGLTVKTSKVVSAVGANDRADQDVTLLSNRNGDPSTGFVEVNGVNKPPHQIRQRMDATKATFEGQGRGASQHPGGTPSGRTNDSPNTVLPQPFSQYEAHVHASPHHSGSLRMGGFTPFMVPVYNQQPQSRYSGDGVNQPPSPLMGSPVSTPTAMMFPQTPFATRHPHQHLSPYSSGAFPSNPFAPDNPMSPQHSGPYGGYFHPLFNNFPQFMPSIVSNRSSLSRSNSIGQYPKPPQHPVVPGGVKRKPSANRLALGGDSASHSSGRHTDQLYGPSSFAPFPSTFAASNAGQASCATTSGCTSGHRSSLLNSAAGTSKPQIPEEMELASGWDVAEEVGSAAAEPGGIGLGGPPRFAFQQSSQGQDGLPAMPMMPWMMGMSHMGLSQASLAMHSYHYHMLMMAAQSIPMQHQTMPLHSVGLPPTTQLGQQVFEFPDLAAAGQHTHMFSSQADFRQGMVFLPPPPPPMNVAAGSAASTMGGAMSASGANRFVTTPPAKPVRRRNVSELKVGPDGNPRLNARQRRTLRRAKERALKGLMEAGHVLLQRNGHLTAFGTDSSGVDTGADSSGEGSDDDDSRSQHRTEVSQIAEEQTDVFLGSNSSADQTELYLGAAISVASGSAGPKAAREAAEALSKAAADLDDMDIGNLISHLSLKKMDGAVDEKLIRDLQIIQNLIGALKIQGAQVATPQPQANRLPRPSPSAAQQPGPSSLANKLSTAAAGDGAASLQGPQAGMQPEQQSVQPPTVAAAAAAAIGMLPPELQGLGMQMKAIMEGKKSATKGETAASAACDVPMSVSVDEQASLGAPDEQELSGNTSAGVVAVLKPTFVCLSAPGVTSSGSAALTAGMPANMPHLAASSPAAHVGLRFKEAELMKNGQVTESMSSQHTIAAVH